jgi:nucleoredoxin
MTAFVSLFGEELASGTETVQTAEVLDGKVVGIYFSAHWCPPCRGFTPKLAEWYTQSYQAKGMEIVFVSSDRGEEAFNDYFAEMPWKALPFADRERKEALSTKFKVQGIPTFVILGTDGSIITKDGRSAVTADPKGEDFPWKPKPFHELIGDAFVGQGKAPLDQSAVEGKVLGLYFSAHWCPPCRGFTPKLAEWYKAVKETLPDFEIVFASSDRDEGSFDEYFAEMPWIALPYADRKRKEALSTLCGVEGIPTLAIIDKDGRIITTNGRGIPEMDPEGKQFPWYPKPIKDLAHEQDGVDDCPSLVVLMDGADQETRDAITAALEPIAKEYQEKAKASGEDEVLFFTGGPAAAGIASRLRSLIKVDVPPKKHEHELKELHVSAGVRQCDHCDASIEGVAYNCAECDFDFCEECNSKAEESPVVPITAVLLDLGDQGGYYMLDDMDVKSEASVRQHLAKYTAKELERKQA